MAEPPALRILFFGTPEFAVPSLQALAASRHPVVGVVSQPDRPRGRGRKLAPTPVREAAALLALPLRQPQRVGDSEALAWMRSLAPDLGVVVAFGQFLPRSVREIAPQGLINGHASLLPRWRGAAPIHWAIRAGDTETGVSVMRIAREMDAGDVCLTRKTPIGPEETAGELAQRLARLTAEALVEAVDLVAEGRAVFAPQDPAGVTLAPKVDRDFARIDWARPAPEVLRHILSATPRPGVDLVLERAGKTIRILAARLASHEAGPESPGSVRIHDGKLRIATLDGWVEVPRLQPQGRHAITSEEFLRGTRIAPDERIRVP